MNRIQLNVGRDGGEWEKKKLDGAVRFGAAAMVRH
jgi:hypothetical protein